MPNSKKITVKQLEEAARIMDDMEEEAKDRFLPTCFVNDCDQPGAWSGPYAIICRDCMEREAYRGAKGITYHPIYSRTHPLDSKGLSLNTVLMKLGIHVVLEEEVISETSGEITTKTHKLLRAQHHSIHTMTDMTAKQTWEFLRSLKLIR